MKEFVTKNTNITTATTINNNSSAITNTTSAINTNDSNNKKKIQLPPPLQPLSSTVIAKQLPTTNMVSEQQQQHHHHHHHHNIQPINGVVSSSTNKVDQQADTIEYMEVEDNLPTTTTTATITTTIEEHEMSDNNSMPSSSTIEQQIQYTLQDVPALMKRLLKPNEYWYILDKHWYDSFLTYLENSKDQANHPGKIDNKELLRPAQNTTIANNNKTSTQTYRLKTTARENEDFVIVPEEVWNLLVNEFGLVDGMGGHPIRCPVIQRTESYYQVELNPLELRLTLYGSKEDMVKQYSRNCTLREVIDDMKKLFNIDDSKPVQLWNNATLLVSHTDANCSSSTPIASSSTLTTASNANVNASSSSTFVPSVTPPPPPPLPTSGGSKAAISDINQRLLEITELEAPNTVLTIEVENPDHTWPSSKTKLGAVTRSKYASGVPNCPPGVCGLMNLGNTCFMNAAIQCLSNTAPLTKYFLADQHLVDINPDNPLGMRGEIARRYAELIKTIWSGFHSSVAPREFKIAVTQFAPQFSGFAHHDCQELMAFLLDGLHEDLNRVKVKPYIEMKNDIERRPDEIVSKEAWANYKRRNDSIIVDTFHAQLKSTLVCPECELVSVTFDPFCYLTLPLPYRIEKPVDILFVPAISKRPMYKKNTISASATSTSSNKFVMNTNYNATPVRCILLENVMIPKTGCASDIRVAVAKFLNDCNNGQDDGSPHRAYFNRKFDPKKMVVANIMECRMNKIYAPTDYYNPHLDDIVVYELDDPPTAQNSQTQGCQTRSSSKFSGYPLPVFIRQINADHSESIISRPFFINLKSLTYENIREAIFKELTSLVHPDKLNCFLQAMEEMFVEEDKNITSTVTTNDKQRTRRSSAGSDGESSDVEEEDMAANNNSSNDNSINNNNENSDDDEGVDEIYGGSGNSKRTRTYPSYSIVTVNNNAQCQLSVIQPGTRLDSSFDDYLAINIHYRIVSKFFPSNLNRAGLLRLSELLPNMATNTHANSLLTLKECINQFTLTEKLGENDPWYCPRCKKHQMASKKFDIWSLPNNLIIHLKRFSYSRLHRDKLNVLVEFPIENLDMSPYVLHNPNKESLVYDLIAVSNHYGELGAGHYTAYAKNFQSNNWYLFDDYSVTPIGDKNKVMTKAAYVLFYQRKQPNSDESQSLVNCTTTTASKI